MKQQGRGFIRKPGARQPLQVQVEMRKADSTAGMYAILVRGALPPGGALWHYTLDYPLRESDKLELDYAAERNGFDARFVESFIRDTHRIMHNYPPESSKAARRFVKPGE